MNTHPTTIILCWLLAGIIIYGGMALGIFGRI